MYTALSCSKGAYQRNEATLPQGSMPLPDDLFALSTEAGFPSDAFHQKPFLLGDQRKENLGKVPVMRQ